MLTLNISQLSAAYAYMQIYVDITLKLYKLFIFYSILGLITYFSHFSLHYSICYWYSHTNRNQYSFMHCNLILKVISRGNFTDKSVLDIKAFELNAYICIASRFSIIPLEKYIYALYNVAERKIYFFAVKVQPYSISHEMSFKLMEYSLNEVVD